MGWSSNGDIRLTEESLKTMSRYRKITTICCAAVFALGLGACGGGSDDGLSATEEDALRQQVADAEAAKQKAEDDKAAAEAAKKKAEDDAAAAKKKADDEAAAMKMAEMIATAAKLYAGIGKPMGDLEAGAATTLAAGYDSAANNAFTVKKGADAAMTLTEDKKTMVADNQGWQGKRYMANKGAYEAVVYSNIGDPTPGMPFNEQYTIPDDTGELNVGNEDSDKVASSSFDQSAGKKEFKLPDNTVRVMLSGTYHGVSGTYNCTPTTTCSASVDEKGFKLDGGAWTFKPGDPEAEVMSNPVTAYASYGWWIHKAANDGDFTASAFVDYKGAEGTAVDSTFVTLQGTATYMGGAAGKYALSSSTGGTNDAGHFTAMAMLEADFDDDEAGGTISGTIDSFMGADGMARDWSVELKEATLDGTNGNIDMANTVWTIDETAAAASGEWKGKLYDKGKDDVPMTAVGTFYTEYGTAGRMVGAFGANVQ